MEAAGHSVWSIHSRYDCTKIFLDRRFAWTAGRPLCQRNGCQIGQCNQSMAVVPSIISEGETVEFTLPATQLVVRSTTRPVPPLLTCM